MNRAVVDYHGNKLRIECDESDMVRVLNETLIKPFEDELNDAWHVDNGAGMRAKDYLSYVGTLMIRKPSEHGILSDNALDRIHMREVSVVSVDQLPDKTNAPSKMPKSQLGTTVFAKIEALKKRHPESRLVWAQMDTDCVVTHAGNSYQFDEAIYAPVKKRGFGDHYSFDRVLILDSSELMFFDPNIRRIFPKQARAAMAA